ncbi:neuropeptide FF receptor 1-like [Stylophora pistillata]|uniref:neuropeptide FF receptor 1-like n=1 Tax=Stylophora pistillata TaxID=50429 RepID=UPI000C04C293|nr:neuropeptide FF receptor 1-like [Stylophora pistillata]
MVSIAEVLLSALFSLLIVIDIVGNVLVCLVVYQSKQMRKPMNYLLANLAVADVVIGVFMLPRHVLHHAFKHPTGASGNYLCKFITGGVFIWLSAAAAGILLIAIATARYYAIVHPFRTNFRLDKKRVLWIMALSWGFACVLTGPSMSAIGYDPQKDFCVEKWIKWYPSQAHVAFVFTVNCAIPIVMMTLLYLRIIHKLWRKEDAITNSVQLARLKSRKRVTVMLIIVTVVHTLCWSPNYVLYLLIFHAPGFYYGSTTYIITVLLILLNAAADPLLYTWYMDGFRKGIQSMLCCCRRDRVHVIGTFGRKTANTPDQVGFSVTTEPNKEQGYRTSTV